VPAGGYTAVPTRLLRHYRRLGLTDQELLLVLELWSHRRGDEPPAASMAQLAGDLGKSPRQVQRLVAGLAARGLLRVITRWGAGGQTQLSNAYDTGPLLLALDALCEERPRDILDLAPRVAVDVPPTTPVSGIVDRDLDPIAIDIRRSNRQVRGREDDGAVAPSLHNGDAGRDRGAILEPIAAFAAAYGDPVPPERTAVRAWRLWRSTALPLGDYLALLRQAGEVVEAYRAEIRSPMAYLFRVLEDLLAREREPLDAHVPPGRAGVGAATAQPWGGATWRAGAQLSADLAAQGPGIHPASITTCPPCPLASPSAKAPAGADICAPWAVEGQSGRTPAPPDPAPCGQDAGELWARAGAALSCTMAPSVFAALVAPCRALGVEGDMLVVQAPDQRSAWNLGRRLSERLADAMSEAGLGHLALRLVVPGEQWGGPAAPGGRDIRGGPAQ
jgi:hypothetical protein